VTNELHSYTSTGATAVPIETFTSVEPDTAFSRFINRDLSLIEFFRRVLEEAQDPAQPLLERLKFISILSSNLDEFFMIRVSGLKDRLGRETGVSADGISTADLLAMIKLRVSELLDQQMGALSNDILPALAREGIVLSGYNSLPENERFQLDKYFLTSVYPVLTPQAVDPTHPFPYISGGSLNIGLMVKPKLNRRVARAYASIGDEFFVRLKIPPFVPRFVSVGGSSNHFVLIEDLTIANIRRLIPEASPESCHMFRITRDADLDLREAETEDLLETMEENLRLRRFGGVVRLEVSTSMPENMADYLERSLEIGTEDVYRIDGPLDGAAMMDVYKLDRPDLKDTPLKTAVPAVFTHGKSTFDIVREGDVLLHHPYMPYSIITNFIKEAAEDPDVLAIKMCLYRIGARSPIAPLLIEASERGKQVTVLIEIKARFDEANNIEWAKRLEQAGVHVIYGLLGLKTHCKTTLIVRREGEKLRRYIHLATGNYNPETSAFYTDLGLLTVNESIGEDATELFNYLTVYSHREHFKELIVAPVCLRERTLELIRRETENARHGRPSGIIAKMNRLADFEVVNALYEASQAGVRIDLIVRGVCTLRPGVPGLSENIRVRSIVGRLLEHSRVYCFENGGDPLVYTGSADWMPRNLDRRVEVLTPVHDPALRNYLRNEFLQSYLRDNVKARQLLEDGTHRRVQRSPGDEEFNSQTSFEHSSNIIRFETTEH
jgi:polyphosphate kinase